MGLSEEVLSEWKETIKVLLNNALSEINNISVQENKISGVKRVKKSRKPLTILRACKNEAVKKKPVCSDKTKTVKKQNKKNKSNTTDEDSKAVKKIEENIDVAIQKDEVVKVYEKVDNEKKVEVQKDEVVEVYEKVDNEKKVEVQKDEAVEVYENKDVAIKKDEVNKDEVKKDENVEENIEENIEENLKQNKLEDEIFIDGEESIYVRQSIINSPIPIIKNAHPKKKLCQMNLKPLESKLRKPSVINYAEIVVPTPLLEKSSINKEQLKSTCLLDKSFNTEKIIERIDFPHIKNENLKVTTINLKSEKNLNKIKDVKVLNAERCKSINKVENIGSNKNLTETKPNINNKSESFVNSSKNLTEFKVHSDKVKNDKLNAAFKLFKKRHQEKVNASMFAKENESGFLNTLKQRATPLSSKPIGIPSYSKQSNESFYDKDLLYKQMVNTQLMSSSKNRVPQHLYVPKTIIPKINENDKPDPSFVIPYFAKDPTLNHKVKSQNHRAIEEYFSTGHNIDIEMLFPNIKNVSNFSPNKWPSRFTKNNG